MKESIKKRIEAVRRGKVPEKYSTERAMLFPDEWGTPVALNTVLSENKDCNEDLRFGKEDVLSVSGEQGIVNQIDLLGRSYAGQSVAPYHVVETGDVVYTKSPLKENPYGIIKQNRGVPGIVSTLYAVYHCSTPITGQYLENYFCIDTYLNNYLKPLVKRGAKNDMKVNNEEVLLGRIPLPPLQEQERINEIITQFDRMIELKQSKIDELNKLKQVCLLEMFPQKGQTIPKRRFLGFSAPWEQRKLGEVGETYTGLSGKSKDDFGHGSGKFITYMNVFSNPVASSNMTEAIEIDDSQNKVQFGDVLFTTSSETPDEVGMSSVWLENAENTYLNSFCFGYRPTTEYNPYYLAYMLRSSSMRKKITFLAQGISRYNISKNKMMDIEMPIPSIDEQKQIGEYFRNLDNLITLHQRELAEVGKYKKALMQLLLTGLLRVNA